VYCFGQAWMCVNRTLQVLGACRELHCEHRLGNKFARHWADDVNAEDFVVVFRRDNFYHAGRLFHRFGPATGGKREGACLVWSATCPNFLFGLADPGNLGRSVDNGRNHVVIDLRDFTGDQVRCHNAFFGALVRQHWSPDAIANGEDTFDTGTALFVDLDKAAFVGQYSRIICKQAVSERFATNGDDEFVDIDVLRAIFVLIRD